MRSEITKLHEKLKTTFIYVTHDQTEAMTMGSKIVVMKDGVIQQVDTPLNLYNHPVNTFVATFLGSPQMNLLEGKLLKEENNYYFVSEELKILIPDSMLLQMSEYHDDMDVYLGVRPSEISLSENGYRTKVELIEQLGNETIIYVRLPGKDELSIVSSNEKDLRIANGDEISLSFDNNHIHLFDKESGLSLVQADVINQIDGNLHQEEDGLYLNNLVLSEERKQHFSKNNLTSLTIKISSNDISLDEKEDCFKEEIKINKIVKYMTYDVVFSLMKDGKPLIIKTTRTDLKEGENVIAYIPFDKADFFENGKKVYSRLLKKDTECIQVKFKKTRSSSILFLPKGLKLKEKQFMIEKLEEFNDEMILKLVGNKTKEEIFVRLEKADLFVGQFVFVK